MSAAQAAKPKRTHKTTGRVDRDKAIELRAKHGLTYAQIGAINGVSKQAIHKLIKHLEPDETTETYKSTRADVLAKVQHNLLSELTPAKVQKMQPRDIVVSMGILYDKERLERGQSTSNMMSVHADLEALRGARREIQEADEIDV